MKRNFIAWMLVLMMALCVPAMADVTTIEFDTYDVSLNEKTGTFAVADKSAGCYVLMDADGNRLTEEKYQLMNPMDTGFEVAMENGTNNMGYIDGQGNLLVPMQYGDINWISDEWQIGVKLELATAENYDYQSWSDDSYYLISANDVYYKGQHVGTLSRMELDYGYAYGDYLYICDREDNSAFYDSTMTKSAYADGEYYSEYDYDYSTDVVWHCGSNQQAFTAGCTLTSENVEQDLYEIDGRVYDLQGNVVFETGNWDIYSDFYGDYAVIRHSDGKLGVVDRSGNIILPCEYDEIDYYDGLFHCGYQVVVKDGKLGYVDLNGNVTAECKYSESIFDVTASPLSSLKDMEGMTIVISGAAGELPERYSEARLSYTDGCTVFAALNAEGSAGVVDMYGNVVVPFDGKYDSVYDFSISEDGSLIGAYSDGVYTFYKLGGAAAPQQTEAEGEPEEKTSEGGNAVKEAMKQAMAGKKDDASAEEAPAEDTSWVCSCGTSNSGKFCTECGSAKPVEAAVCTGCGYTPAEGETPKFCPECGTKF